MTVKMETFLNVTTIAVVAVVEFTVTEIKELKPTSSEMTINWVGNV